MPLLEYKYSNERFCGHEGLSRLAQLAERVTVNHEASGSIPLSRDIFVLPFFCNNAMVEAK